MTPANLRNLTLEEAERYAYIEGLPIAHLLRRAIEVENSRIEEAEHNARISETENKELEEKNRMLQEELDALPEEAEDVVKVLDKFEKIYHLCAQM